MIKVYYNYPNSHVTVHRNSYCGLIQMMDKQDQRTCCLDITTISKELHKLNNKGYRFQSKAELNDIWIEINFHATDFEIAVARYVRWLLGKHYKRFRESSFEIHC